MGNQPDAGFIAIVEDSSSDLLFMKRVLSMSCPALEVKDFTSGEKCLHWVKKMKKKNDKGAAVRIPGLVVLDRDLITSRGGELSVLFKGVDKGIVTFLYTENEGSFPEADKKIYMLDEVFLKGTNMVDLIKGIKDRLSIR